MSEYWINFLSTIAPMFVSLIAAIIGLIMTALKYKKQKYAIAMLEEQNKFLEAQNGRLTDDEIAELRAILEEVHK